MDYLHNNPVKDGFVFGPYGYRYSSAIDYAGGLGYVSIELILYLPICAVVIATSCKLAAC